MKNDEVAEDFAKGLNESKTQNVFIEGKTIYSYGYHFPIAKKIGNNKVLFNTKGYSNSTAKHKSYVLSELQHKGYEIIYIFDCDLEKAEQQILRNNEEITYLKDKLKRVRSKHIEENHKTQIKSLGKQNDFLKDIAMPRSI